MFALLRKYAARPRERALTPRQVQALALSATYPGEAGSATAKRTDVSHSTFRNLVSTACVRMEVSNRAEAILQAQQLGLLAPDHPASAAAR